MNIEMLNIKRMMGHWISSLMVRVVPWLTVLLYRGSLGVVLATCRWRIEGLASLQGALKEGSCALAVWHDRLALLAPLLSRYAPEHRYLAVVSNSREGKLLGRLVATYRQGRALAVPHDKRSGALLAMIHTLRKGERALIITPDGPRGPRHCLKQGIALAAIHSKAKVIIVKWKATRCWELATWDRMAIPKPFSTIEVVIEAPLSFPGDISPEEAALVLQAAMEG